jgi:hypothetical protein
MDDNEKGRERENNTYDFLEFLGENVGLKDFGSG